MLENIYTGINSTTEDVVPLDECTGLPLCSAEYATPILAVKKEYPRTTRRRWGKSKVSRSYLNEITVFSLSKKMTEVEYGRGS